MSRVIESEWKPSRITKLRVITLKSSVNVGSQMCCYTCCFELVRAKRIPN